MQSELPPAGPMHPTGLLQAVIMVTSVQFIQIILNLCFTIVPQFYLD